MRTLNLKAGDWASSWCPAARLPLFVAKQGGHLSCRWQVASALISMTLYKVFNLFFSFSGFGSSVRIHVLEGLSLLVPLPQ